MILSSLWEKLSTAHGHARNFRVRPLWTHGIALVFHWLFICNLLRLTCFFTLYPVNEILCGAVHYRLVCNPNPALIVLLLSLTRYIDINEQDEPFCVTKESNWVSESLCERITINLESSNLQEHSKLEIMSMITKPALRFSFTLFPKVSATTISCKRPRQQNGKHRIYTAFPPRPSPLRTFRSGEERRGKAIFAG